jgi:uroporphyrinogen decarboxylase
MKLHNRTPDIGNLYTLLRREVPSRPTLFELFMNDPLYEVLTGQKAPEYGSLEYLKFRIAAFAAAGYDYTTTNASSMEFQNAHRAQKKSTSLNEGFVITDEKSYESFVWPDPEKDDYSQLEKIKEFLPGNMKLMVMGPSGVLENVTSLVGYDNLCYMLADDPDLAGEIFNRVGSTLLRYYEHAASYESVGLLMINDDWGFNTQTLLSPTHLRQYVIPWHKKMVQVAHDHHIPAVLHSCGNLEAVMEDIIEIGYDGKHSYQDVILPVEEAYERYHDRIAILGGIDVDFLIRREDRDITTRCQGMLERTATRGAWAMGTGNSVPEYIPNEKYFLMIQSALSV